VKSGSGLRAHAIDEAFVSRRPLPRLFVLRHSRLVGFERDQFVAILNNLRASVLTGAPETRFVV
jgi:hypothetical protein